MKHLGRYILSLCCMMALASCSKDDALEPDGDFVRQAEVTYLVSPNGLGDNGYNDAAAEGIFAFAGQTGTRLRLLLPSDEAEAEAMYRQWITENAAQDSAVLVVGSEAYGSLVAQTPLGLTGRGTRVLLFESGLTDLPDGASAFIINRYGVAYLCGAMSGMLSALVFAAAPGYATLNDAISGFMDGYEAHHAEGKKAELIYLADGETGFAMPDSAYHVLSRRMEDFFFYNEMVFPLLGGSGVGVLRCMNDYESNLGLIIGMDVDQSSMSPRVPFSMVIRTGDVLHNYLDDWLAGQDWPKSRTIGMSEGGTAVMLHPSFYERKVLTLGSYSDPNTFQGLYDAYKNEAMRKEEAYGK